MISRINILKIIIDHFGTLKSYGSDSRRINFSDLFLFIILPIIISILLVYYGFSFQEQLTNLIAGISIFGGFLFNLLAIIYSQLESIEKNNESTDDMQLHILKKKFVDEIHINISFCIVLSIIIVISLFLSTIDFPIKEYDSIFKNAVNGINYFLLILFLLSLLMVINRVYILLKRK